MTAIIRINEVQINNSSSISVFFTEHLTSNLVPSNVSILSETENVPDSLVLKVEVSENILSIVCQPLTPLAAYFIQLQSTLNNPFISVNGDAKISEDGVSNKFLITGPISSDNPVKNYLDSFYHNNIYDINNSNSVIAKYIQSISINFARALYDIRQIKNENYLSFTTIDELKIRGEGPFDRLNEEASYDVFRVARGPTSAIATTNFIFSNFPHFPITLQKQNVIETIKSSSNNENGTFNINNLIFNLNNFPITKVNSIIFTLTTNDPIYTYNVSVLGYQLLNSRYDQDFASNYLILKNNQVKLNEKILQDPKFSLDQILSIEIDYEYKNLGREVDSNTVNVFTTLQSIREVLPPIINIFNLMHAPIIDVSGNIPNLDGVIFTDPNSNTGNSHPAFITEIPFSLSSLPSSPGIYSIDYSSGTVYVYGENFTNDGTGPSPPLATYYYKFVYTSEIDYVYDFDLLDMIALPLGNLINQIGTINFNYEEALIPNIDYVADTHIESLNERINNSLISLNVLKTQNSPITNVFQIYNETSGEIYALDRWNDNKIYFRYNNPPRILNQIGENSIFENIVNEILCVNSITSNVDGYRIFTIYLSNNTIINSTQDGIASSFNTSLVFNNGNIFIKEKWFNQEFNITNNINRLINIGEFMVDYKNGIIYLATSNSQNTNLGTASYKINNIVPNFPHVISADDIYYRISFLEPKNKQFSYLSFAEGSIIPQNLDVSDEAFLNNNVIAPYQYFQGSIGAFVDSTFIPTVTNSVKFIRSIYEYNDLLNSTNPINFATVSTNDNFNIKINSINKQSFESVQFDGTNYFVILNENIPYLSSGIIYTFNIIRASDSESLWNNNGIVVAGSSLKLILPGINNPQVNDLVNISYSFSIVPLERVIVDYNKGDFFIDYTYLADEILVSYEYGDNVIDFRMNKNLPTGTQYYVSYKSGALRDALLKNFGTLVNVPDLNNFDLTLNRERYREALQAALSSFIKGPTIEAIKNIGNTISHIEPDIIESAFDAWSLGSNLLFPIKIQTTGNFELLPAHFNNGVLINQNNQTINIPVNSNLRLEEGTFETWIIPQWNGIDNNSNLTFNITKDGYAIKPYNIFIGAAENHPNIINNNFILNKNDANGIPNTNKDGIFIYYANDKSGNFQRWFIEIIDGYVHSNNHNYKFKINSTGKFYDVKSISINKPSNMNIFTGLNSINFTITGGAAIDEGITFISDIEHYILDFGENENSSRLSIFKDISGYLNFRVYDKIHNLYSISADVSSWKANTPHMIAASWKLNTRNERDEMHLFIDGFEVPNIIKYGQKLKPYLHEKFRTVNPEEIVGLSNRDIVGSDDLIINAGSTLVSSSINFSSFNIFPGDTIYIDEIGFSSIGYSILNINGQTLTLNAPMPTSLNNGRFSVNRTQYIITSDINIFPNIAISTMHPFIQGNDLITQINSNIITSSGTNFTNAGVLPGFLIRIDHSSFSLTYNIVQVSGNTITITDNATINLSNVSYQIYSGTENEIPGLKSLNPDYSISKNNNFNNILTISNGVFANDLILIRTLGLNFKNIKKQHYIWGDGYENILMTRLSPPISLDEANITKVILPSIIVGPSNSTYSLGFFTSVHLPTDGYIAQPSNIINGRTVQATISGTNTDFTSNTQVIINGLDGITPISETINFSNYGTLDFINTYTTINWIQVITKPINSSKNSLSINVKEKYPITYSEFGGIAPVIKYSYHIGGGYNLQSDGYDNIVTDGYNVFSALDIGNYLLIHSPSNAAGYYIITGLLPDRHSIAIKSTSNSHSIPLSSFTNGIYQILYTNAYRSGLQNGFFTLEKNNAPGQPYLLNHGFYELEYSTYISVKFNPINTNFYLGSDFNGSNQINAILDQTVIYSAMLLDTRIGELISNNQYSITKDFNSLKELKINDNILMMLNFNSFPFTNLANFKIKTNNDHIHFKSSWSVNDNFEQSLVILDKPLIVSNDGILDTRKQGTIEFWMSPIYDTANDPQDRFYFDAYSAIIEETTSINNVSVKISTPASKILSVTLSGNPTIDYFAGGQLEIDTQNAFQEESVSIGNSSVIVSQPILQIITVKIIGDFTEIDYFDNGTISSDQKTIYLGKTLPQNNLPLMITYQTTNNKNITLNTQVIRLNKKLPSQNSKVIVKYLPKGIQGDRLSIFKDKFGYMNFAIIASNNNFVVRAPTRWAKNTWHRVKASYKINNGFNSDEMRLFLDGYQYTDVLSGQGIVFGNFPMVMGSVSVGDGYGLTGNINFKDPINELFIGTDYTGSNPIFTLLDNFRISNLSRPIYAPYGEPIDVNYSNNLNTVFPVTKDLFTTYLMDFNDLIDSNINFSTLINRATGSFDFTVNIFDSFGIISNSSPKVKEILENLINILKPANTRVFIKYNT